MQSLAENSAGFRLLHLSQGPGHGVILDRKRFEFLAACEVPESSRPPESIYDQIAAQSQGPVGETAAFGPKGAEVLIYPDEYLLGKIFCLISSARIVIAQGKDASGLPGAHPGK